MRKIKLLSFVLTTALLWSCGGAADQEEGSDSADEETLYGGVFRMSIGSYNKNVKVREVKKLEEGQIYCQIFDGLVRYNAATLEIEPSLATEWQISEDGKTYTFTLREGVFFHDNDCFEGGKGRELTPEDVVYSFEQIYDPNPDNSAYTIFQNAIMGGDAFHDEQADSIQGISIDGRNIIFELNRPGLAFIQKMASVYGSIIPRESMDVADYIPVGTGPFAYDKKNSTSEIVKLYRNNNYYETDVKGNQLPFLDSAVFVYFENADDQMEEFWNSSLSYIRKVPVQKISEVMEERIGEFESKPPKYVLGSEPELTTTYLELNMNTPVFRKKKVRQALNYAVNRKKIFEKILKNQAYEIGKFGVVPPLPAVFNNYDFEGVEDTAYVYNPQLAKQLLAEAGYPNGKNFPSIQMQFKMGSTDYLVASEIQNQLRSVIGINLEIEAVEFNQMLENKAYGRSDIFRTNWIGDYPLAETFLSNAYGKIVPKSMDEPSYRNSARYNNPKFDEILEAAMVATNVDSANVLYSQAEKILMDDAPFIVLWYGEDLWLKQAHVNAFETNSIGYLDLTATFFKASVEEKEELEN